MSSPRQNPHVVERTLIALAIVLLLFLSPLSQFWAGAGIPWYGPYLVWGLTILLIYLLQRHINKT